MFSTLNTLDAKWCPIAKTIQAQTLPLPGDRTGRVRDGFLVLKGMLRAWEDGLDKLSVYGMVCVSSDGGSDTWRRAYEASICLYTSYPNAMVGKPIFFLPLQYTHDMVWHEYPDGDVCCTSGIILSSTGVRGEYVRVGAFNVYGEKLLAEMFSDQDPLPAHCFAEFDGHDQYTVRII